WAPGYAAAVTAAGGVPVMLTPPKPGVTWAKVLRDLDGVVFLGGDPASPTRAADEKRFCEWCRDRELPLLAVDQGLLSLNTTLGVQWQPGAASASGLDIQLFRGLVDACRQPQDSPRRSLKSSAA